MISRKILLLMWLFSSVSLAPGPARAQAPAGPGAVGQLGTSRSQENQEWHIFGRVTTLNGEPVAAAKVKVDIGSGMNSVQTLETNLRGEFRTQYDLNANLYKRLAVNVTATKAGCNTTCTQTFSATDNVKPVITLSPSTAVQCNPTAADIANHLVGRRAVGGNAVMSVPLTQPLCLLSRRAATLSTAIRRWRWLLERTDFAGDFTSRLAERSLDGAGDFASVLR